jgi:hypothetical protein
MMEYWNVDLKEELLSANMLAPMSRVVFPIHPVKFPIGNPI